MPMKAARPPKKGSKKDIDAKAKKLSDKDSEISTAISSMSLESHVSLEKEEDEGRVATGILTSEVRARDIKISAFSLSLFGRVLVEDTTIELNARGRYGLLGRNGSGKVIRHTYECNIHVKHLKNSFDD